MKFIDWTLEQWSTVIADNPVPATLTDFLRAKSDWLKSKENWDATKGDFKSPEDSVKNTAIYHAISDVTGTLSLSQTTQLIEN